MIDSISAVLPQNSSEIGVRSLGIGADCQKGGHARNGPLIGLSRLAEFARPAPKPLRNRSKNERIIPKTVQRSVKATNYRTHFRRFRTVCRPMAFMRSPSLRRRSAEQAPEFGGIAVLCSRGWPPLATWPTSRRCRRYWVKPASLPKLPLEGLTWRACAAACGLFVSAPFLRELYAGEEHKRRALPAVAFFRTWPTSRTRWRSSPGQPVWGDLPRTTRRGAPVRQRAAFRSRIGFLQFGDARLFAFLAATARDAGGKSTEPDSFSDADFLPRRRVYELKVIITCRRF